MHYAIDPSSGKIISYMSGVTARAENPDHYCFSNAEEMYAEFGEQLTLKLFERHDTRNHEELFTLLAQRVGKTWRSFKRPDNIEKEPAMANKISKDSVITINPDYTGRPRRPGSKLAELFTHYKDGMTVEEWLVASGGSVSNVRKDASVGRILLSK